MSSADQILAEFIATGEVWYIARPDKRPALMTDVRMADSGPDGVCLFRGRQEALDFLRESDALPGQFRPRRGAPHPRRPQGVSAFVRVCRRYSPYLCLPWPTDDGQHFDLYILEIKQLLVASRRADRRTRSGHSPDDPETERRWRFAFDHQRLPFSDN